MEETEYRYDTQLLIEGTDLDEDEMGDLLGGNQSSCPMYRFYDEYKSVQKQN